MKYQDAYNKIKAMIKNNELGESGARLISAQELCKLCNISFVNTLKILRQLKDEFYLGAIDQKLYIVNGLAKKRSDLRKFVDGTKRIGILVPSFVNPHFAEILENLYEYLNAQGYEPILYLCKEITKDTEALKYFIQNRCEGVIVLSHIKQDASKNLYQRFPLPLVVSGKIIDGLNASFVTSENHSTGALVAKHLIVNGYNRFIYIAPKHHQEMDDARMLGFLDGLKSANQPDEYVRHLYFNSLDYTWKRQLTTYLESLPPSTKVGIFCYHDLIAFETYTYLSNAGFNIPNQVGIVGYDNLEISQTYKLSTCSYSYKEMIQQIFSCLIERIENTNAQAKYIKVQTVLLSRNSTKATSSYPTAEK